MIKRKNLFLCFLLISYCKEKPSHARVEKDAYETNNTLYTGKQNSEVKNGVTNVIAATPNLVNNKLPLNQGINNNIPIGINTNAGMPKNTNNTLNQIADPTSHIQPIDLTNNLNLPTNTQKTIQGIGPINNSNTVINPTNNRNSVNILTPSKKCSTNISGQSNVITPINSNNVIGCKNSLNATNIPGTANKIPPASVLHSKNNTHSNITDNSNPTLSNIQNPQNIITPTNLNGTTISDITTPSNSTNATNPSNIITPTTISDIITPSNSTNATNPSNIITPTTVSDIINNPINSSKKANQPISTTNCTYNNECYIATYKTAEGQTEFCNFLISLNVKILKQYNLYFKGVHFCTSPNLIKKIKNHFLLERLEKDTRFAIQSVQYDLPRHFKLIQHYANYFFNNYLLDNFIFNLLPFNFLNRLFGGYRYEYTGINTDIFLIDTTIDQNEADLNGRVINLFNSRVCNTHGTNIAMLSAGEKMGLAKNSRVYGLNIVDCAGHVLLSQVLEALGFVHTKINRRTILLFGVSGPRSEILNKAIDEISRLNIIVVAPSGNDAQSACKYSPGSAYSTITVGSLNKHAGISHFSNYGDCVRIFTLGEDIQLSFRLFDSIDMQGTSVSAAIISGAVAIYLEKYENAGQSEVWDFLSRNSWRRNNSRFVFILPELNRYSSRPRAYGMENFYFLRKYDGSLFFAFFVFFLFICFGLLLINKIRTRNAEEGTFIM